MGLILLILGIGAVVWTIGAMLAWAARDREPLIVLGFIGTAGPLIALIVVGLVISIKTTNTAIVEEAFYYENAAIYQDAVSQLKSGVPIHTDELGQGALFLESANLKQIESYAKAVNVERWELVNYNESLRRTRHWQNSFMFGLLWANVSDDIKPILVE